MIPPKRPKMMQVISVKQNVSRMAKSVVALRRKVRETLYGLPEDQTTAAERKIIRDCPQYFENDRGYIKVKVTGKRRARNPRLTHPDIKSVSEYQLVAGNGRPIRKATKVTFTNGEVVKFIEKMPKGEAIKQALNLRKNPYASEAQRRKFHAMAERGEISQAVVNEYDRKSKGKRLPKRANSLASLKRDYRTRYGITGSFTKSDAAEIASVYGIDFNKDFHTLSFDQQSVLNDLARLIGYKKSKFSSGSLARAFFSYMGKERRNATADDFKSYQKVKLQDLIRKFQGHANGLKHRVLQSDLTPKNKYLLGCLALMKVKANGKIIPIEFSGAAYLAADLRNNLHAVGKDAIIENVEKPNPGQLKELGKLIQIDYITAKSHIENGETVRFWHKLGEVDAEHPTLFIDSDGFPIINGGGYDIWSVGIVN